MMNTKIEITEQGDPIEAISVAITIAKALNLEMLGVNFKRGFTLVVSKDSLQIDIVKMYDLTLKVSNLERDVRDLQQLNYKYEKEKGKP